MSKSCFNLDEFKTLFDASEDMTADIVTMARIAEAAERYEDMCQCMKKLVSVKEYKNLSVEERNLLSVAYKNVIGTRRASWRTLSAEADHSSSSSADLAMKYNKVVEKELVATCEEVIDILKDLLPAADASSDAEANVFYLKMAGDYYRYLAESIDTNAEYPLQAEKYYKEAHKVATAEKSPGEPNLVPTHPIRLGLALNYSVCHYEILKNKQAACDLAKKAFDDAIAKLDKLEESDYKDSTLIMQLLRDNLTLWNSTTGDDGSVQVEDLSDEEN